MAQYQEGQRLQGSDGKVYVVQGGVPREAQSAPQSAPPAFIPGTPKPDAQPTPFQIEDQQMQRNRDARQQAQWEASHNPDGSEKPKIVSDGKPTEYQAKSAGFLGRLMDAESTIANVPADSKDARSNVGQWFHEAMPGIENQFNSPERQSFDQAARNFIAASLRQESGAAISKEEYTNQYRIFFPQPGDGPELIKQKADARSQAIEGFKIAAGPLASRAEATVAPPSAGQTNAPPSFAPGEPEMKANTSGFKQEDDPALVQAGVSKAYAAMLQQNTEPGQAITKLREMGVTDPEVLKVAAAQLAYRRKNPNTPLDQYKFPAIDDRAVPLSGFSQTINDVVGNDPSGLGGYLVGAGQFLSGNTLDNMSSNPEQARASMDVLRTQSPNAMAVGEVSGGIMGALSGEAALARMGMSGGIARGALADTAMGAGNGAGAADDGNRFAGAAMGGGAALTGSLAGGALAKGIGRAVSPSGGGMNALYEAGVRPTLGQRVSNAGGGKGFKGMAGRAINATEEALQSVPLVGSAIRGARQEARDQFQVGAFNEALREVGEKLPKGVGPGTVAHGYAQKTFNRVYAEARKEMQFVGDKEFTDEITGLADEIGSLGPQNSSRLKAILKNRVANKIDDTGSANGDAYKRMVSGLDEQIRTIGKDPQAMELTSVLSKVKGAVEAAARRHSPKESVDLLDAADAGYAKFVRIEEAARRRGGDAGTFSPAQFDSAVQNTSGGVRSKAYLRGDALMQDYANAGRGLDDKLPNSGTADRVMAGYAVGAPAAGGAIFLSPQVAAVLGAIGTAYAPGVRKVVKGAMAPGGPKSKAVRVQLEKRARLLGRTGAATGGAASLETSPGQ